ncbi:MAG: class I SAM-dependent methyltransferase [Candidatus Aenigmatarchaeota archaeon]
MKDVYEITRKTYDKTAKEYARLTYKKGMFRGCLEKFISYLRKGSLVLDVGCGSGRDSEYLANRGMSVIGIDYSEKMLDEARERVKNCKFVKMDMRKLEFGNDTFDGVWAMASLLHIPKKDVASVLSGLNRLLKTGGILFVSVKEGKGEGLVEGVHGESGKKFFAFYEMVTLKEFLEKFGFKTIDVFLKKDLFGRHVRWLCLFARKVKA